MLTFSTSGLPAGVSVAASTGLISGTPPTAGTHAASATVTATGGSASRSFTVTVRVSDGSTDRDADFYLDGEAEILNAGRAAFTRLGKPNQTSCRGALRDRAAVERRTLTEDLGVGECLLGGVTHTTLSVIT